MPLDEFVRQFLAATGDPRNVIADVDARYFGIALNDQSLTPGANPHLGKVRFGDWLSQLTRQDKTGARG